MVKNLNKNRSVVNRDTETVVEKKIKKKKSKLIEKQIDEDSIEVKKKKRKRKISDENKINDEETATKTARNETENDTEKPEDDNDKNNDKKPKALSKKQIKKAKAEQREIEKREQSKQEATRKALNYISMWKHAKSEWKFAKIKQIWLMDNLLDEDAVPDSIFPTVLEYFEGCKGMARETLLKKGMDVIKKHEQKIEESEDIIESVELKRARLLLQALPTET